MHTGCDIPPFCLSIELRLIENLKLREFYHRDRCRPTQEFNFEKDASLRLIVLK